MLRNLVLDRGLDFQIIRGVSVGALNASFLAQAPTQPDEQTSLAELKKKVGDLENLWRNEIKGNHSVYSARPGGLLGLAAGADSLYSLEPLSGCSETPVRSGAEELRPRLQSRHRVVPRPLRRAARTILLRDKLLARPDPGRVSVCRSEKTEGRARGRRRAQHPPLSSAFAASTTEIYVLLTSRLIRGKELRESGVQER